MQHQWIYSGERTVLPRAIIGAGASLLSICINTSSVNTGKSRASSRRHLNADRPKKWQKQQSAGTHDMTHWKPRQLLTALAFAIPAIPRLRPTGIPQPNVFRRCHALSNEIPDIPRITACMHRKRAHQSRLPGPDDRGGLGEGAWVVAADYRAGRGGRGLASVSGGSANRTVRCMAVAVAQQPQREPRRAGCRGMIESPNFEAG
jgi:hypothetical protein